MYNFALDFGRAMHSRPNTQPAIEMLVRDHAMLVRRIAWHVHARMSSAIEIEDLIQTGLAALVEAGRTFEDRGILFAPYAATRIRGAMIDSLRRQARMSRTGMANRRKLAGTRARLELELGRSVCDAEMAAALQIGSDAYHQMVATTHAMRLEPIDEAYSDHDADFADHSDAADCALEKIQQTRMLAEHIEQLPEREALILQLYFTEEMNLEEIGLILNVGAARVCQIKKTALTKLRHMMTDR
jgi:RNA polymerase sigma factor FliA